MKEDVLHIQDRPFLIINLYNPNIESEQVKVIEDLGKLINSIDSDHDYQIILGGHSILFLI